MGFQTGDCPADGAAAWLIRTGTDPAADYVTDTVTVTSIQ